MASWVWTFRTEPNEDEALSPSVIRRGLLKSLAPDQDIVHSRKHGLRLQSVRISKGDMMSTPDKIAEYEELDRQQKRVLTSCFTLGNIPLDANHRKWIEYKQWEQSVKGLQPGAAPGNEHAAGQLQPLPLTGPLGWPRPTIPSQGSNMMMEIMLGAAAQVSPKACLSQGYCSGFDRCRMLWLPKPQHLYATCVCR